MYKDIINKDKMTFCPDAFHSLWDLIRANVEMLYFYYINYRSFSKISTFRFKVPRGMKRVGIKCLPLVIINI